MIATDYYRAGVWNGVDDQIWSEQVWRDPATAIVEADLMAHRRGGTHRPVVKHWHRHYGRYPMNRSQDQFYFVDGKNLKGCATW